MNLKEQGGVYGRFQSEERERRNYVIILQSQKMQEKDDGLVINLLVDKYVIKEVQQNVTGGIQKVGI